MLSFVVLETTHFIKTSVFFSGCTLRAGRGIACNAPASFAVRLDRGGKRGYYSIIVFIVASVSGGLATGTPP